MGPEYKKDLSPGKQNMDTSPSVLGKRDRPPSDGVDAADDSHVTQEKRYRADTLRLALVADIEVVGERA